MQLNQITVPSTDLHRSVSFYQTLGLRLIVDALPRYARFELPDGDATFSLHLVDQVATGNGVMVYFEHEALDEKVASLQAAGIPVDLLPQDQPWGWREARLKDPDGNQLVLFWGGDYRKNPPWRVKT